MGTTDSMPVPLEAGGHDRPDQALSLLSSGRYDEAAAILESLDSSVRGSRDGLALLAEARVGQGRCAEAMEIVGPLLQNEPRDVLLRSIQGSVFACLDRFQDALRFLSRTPDRLLFHLARGQSFAALGDFAEAERAVRRALQLAPGNVTAWTLLGEVLGDQARHAEALSAFASALKIDPVNARARLGRGKVRLALGDFHAWPELDWRLNLSGHASPYAHFGPAWDGTSPQGKTLLLMAEPDVSDQLMFVRYAGVLKRAGARIILACEPRMKALLSRAEGVDGVATCPDDLADERIDAHVDLMSLPALLGTGPSSIPDEPYLSADPDLASRWSTRLAELNAYRVAIHWANERVDRRCIPLATFAPLSEISEAVLISAQSGPPARSVRDVQFPIADFSPALAFGDDDLVPTAALLASSDLLITNDSPVAHLAGGLGVRTWVALPVGAEWRWGTDRSESLWYPSMHLFRQRRQGDWDSLFATMAQSLRAQISLRNAIRVRQES